MSNDSHPTEHKKPEGESREAKKESLSLRSLRPNTNKTQTQTSGALLEYLKANTKDSIAYVLMIVGMLFMLFDSVSLIGGLIVGTVFSVYFANELAFMVSHAKEFIEEYGVAKSLILAGALLVLLVKVPFFFIAVAVVTAIRVFVWPDAKL